MRNRSWGSNQRYLRNCMDVLPLYLCSSGIHTASYILALNHCSNSVMPSDPSFLPLFPAKSIFLWPRFSPPPPPLNPSFCSYNWTITNIVSSIILYSNYLTAVIHRGNKKLKKNIVYEVVSSQTRFKQLNHLTIAPEY